MQVTLNDQIKCVQREIAMRKACYSKWVDGNRMKQDMADKELAAMEAVLDTLAEYNAMVNISEGAA